MNISTTFVAHDELIATQQATPTIPQAITYDLLDKSASACCSAAYCRLHVLIDEDGIQPLMIAAVVAAIGERSDVDLTQLARRYVLLLSHEQAEVRESVSAAVAAWGPQAALLADSLVIALDDDEPLVRENAALALGRSGVSSETIVTALQTAAADEDEGVAEVVRDSLRRLGRSIR